MMMRSMTPNRLGQVIVLVTLAIAVMIARHHGHLGAIQGLFARMTMPVYQFVNKPFEWGHAFLVSSKQNQMLIEHNAQLRAKIMLLRARLQTVQALEVENKQLMALLRSSTSIGASYVCEFRSVNATSHCGQRA